MKIIDVNYKSGKQDINESPSLTGYSFLIDEIENNIKIGMARDIAIKEAINLCIRKNILADYLKANFEGVVNMLTFEYNRDDERKALIGDGIVIGRAEGRQEGLQEGRDILIGQMLNMGKSLEEISDFTGIPINELVKYRNHTKH